MLIDPLGIGDALAFEAAVKRRPGGIVDPPARLCAGNASLVQSPANCSFHAGQWSVSVWSGLAGACPDQSVQAIGFNPGGTGQGKPGQPPSIGACRYAVPIR